MLDLGYPSNFATFGDLFGHEVPAVLVKYPQKIHQMFHHDDVTPEMIHLEHDDIDLWGTTFSHKDLGKLYLGRKITRFSLLRLTDGWIGGQSRIFGIFG